MNRKLAGTVILCALWTLTPLSSTIAQQQKDDTVPVTLVIIGLEADDNDALASGYRVSKLLHAPVYNDNNQKIGKIKDLIIAPDGSISAAIVDVGGFLGMGTHRVAIPVEQFSQVTPKVILPGATKEALKQVPEFKDKT